MGVNLGYMSMINIFDAGEPLLGFTNITCWGQFTFWLVFFFCHPIISSYVAYDCWECNVLLYELGRFIWYFSGNEFYVFLQEFVAFVNIVKQNIISKNLKGNLSIINYLP